MANKPETAEEIQKALAAPFTKTVAGKTFPAIKWLPKDTKSNQGKIMCVPFIDRELVINRLNDVLGINGWQFSPKREGDGSKTGELSIKVEGDWITRGDTGTASKYDGEKGSTSDSLKRAATQFGVGTYLYSIGHRWINGKQNNSGKMQPVDHNGKFLYGDQVSVFLNGMSTEQGALAQLLSLKPDLYERPEIKKLWDELKIK
jgi:hypothetical protein